MIEDSNIIDELFERIASLENENQQLENKIKNIQSEIDKKESVLEENPELIELQNLLNREKLESKSDLTNVDINYIPFDNFSEIFIAGDFTNWEKKPMKNENGKWTSEFKLAMGYQYFYCFYFRDEVLIDFNQEYKENVKNG